MFTRLLALLGLAALLVSSFAAPIHKHDASQEATCLICHATQRADVISIGNDAGKPLIAGTASVAELPARQAILDFSYAVRIPRAPPVLLLSL